MAWRIEVKETAQKQIAKLEKPMQTAILRFLRERVEATDNPRLTGKALKGDKGELWRYRVGDYRLICQIHDATVTVLVLQVGHRREVYR